MFKIIYFTTASFCFLASIAISNISLLNEGDGKAYSDQQIESRKANIYNGISIIERMKETTQASIDHSLDASKKERLGKGITRTKNSGPVYRKLFSHYENIQKRGVAILALDTTKPIFSEKNPPKKYQVEEVHSNVLNAYESYKNFIAFLDLEDDMEKSVYKYKKDYLEILIGFEETPTNKLLVMDKLHKEVKNLFSGEPSFPFLLSLFISMSPDIINASLVALSLWISTPPSTGSTIRQLNKGLRKKIKLLDHYKKESELLTDAILKADKPMKNYIEVIIERMKTLTLYETFRKGLSSVLSSSSHQAKNDSVFNKDTSA